ncbi:mediator of RNA polymerase II transcription subunit 27-like [Gordionus sp. m RMFG-2023]|uniref:mediator of RNA polymerase II transcription subunit 27-like n=1 Tax=Gordionus sp. m RMFG-2023 TaxID=3053472 RepID=UPI0031FC6E60
MHEESTSDLLNNSLKSLYDLKFCVKTLLETFSLRKETPIASNINKIQNQLKHILALYGTLGKNISVLNPANMSLGNLSYLSQDPFSEKNNLYKSTLQAYRWANILSENSAIAASLTAQNSLKRSTTNNIFNIKKNRQISLYNVSPQIIETMVIGLNRLFLDMSVSIRAPSTAISYSAAPPPPPVDDATQVPPQIPTAKGPGPGRPPYPPLSQPHMTPALQSSVVVLDVVVGQVLRARVCLRSLIVEAVVVRAYDERYAVSSRFESDDIVSGGESYGGNVWYWSEVPSAATNALSAEIWIESRYHVFRKITEYAQAAMLHFYSPLIPELAIKSFMTWLHSYSSLFSATCHKCQKHLRDFLPPTWRDFRTLEPYHEFCRF